jgi:cytochrome oxidase Cu insertion factor (SCO1/SenC/PrrC family)
MQKIQEATEGQPVRLLSLTLDPVDDTVPVLARYSSAFGANLTRWSFLTGDEATVHNLVATSFLPPDTTGQFSYMPGSFAHVQRIVLVDKAGQIVSYFDGLNQNAADAVIAQIKKLESTP